MIQIWPFRPLKTIQPNTYFYNPVHWYHPNETTCQNKRKKLADSFDKIKLYEWTVDDGRRADEGQLSIRKAPLPFG